MFDTLAVAPDFVADIGAPRLRACGTVTVFAMLAVSREELLAGHIPIGDRVLVSGLGPAVDAVEAVGLLAVALLSTSSAFDADRGAVVPTEVELSRLVILCHQGVSFTCVRSRPCLEQIRHLSVLLLWKLRRRSQTKTAHISVLDTNQTALWIRIIRIWIRLIIEIDRVVAFVCAKGTWKM